MAVVGATGVVGRAVVPTLVAAGHDVVGVARSESKARWLREHGAEAWTTTLSDHEGLVAMFREADVVANFAIRSPVGLAAARARAWKANDRLRTEGVRRVLAAARESRVRRVVQESESFLYADQGDAWITESSPLAITCATEPASVGESYLEDYACGSRVGVVLRLGTIVGEDPLTRRSLRTARRGHPIGLGAPETWAHVVHTDDLGPAVLAALHVPSGTYNVGARPVRREDVVAGFAAAAGRDSVDFVGSLTRRFGGDRLEPLTRSLRVSSELFAAAGGWSPRRDVFDATWFTDAQPSAALP